MQRGKKYFLVLTEWEWERQTRLRASGAEEQRVKEAEVQEGENPSGVSRAAQKRLSRLERNAVCSLRPEWPQGNWQSYSFFHLKIKKQILVTTIRGYPESSLVTVKLLRKGLSAWGNAFVNSSYFYVKHS